jgi:hypothetical protein
VQVAESHLQSACARGLHATRGPAEEMATSFDVNTGIPVAMGVPDDGNPTESSRLQAETEQHVLRFLMRARSLEEAGQFGEHVQGGLTLQRSKSEK